MARNRSAVALMCSNCSLRSGWTVPFLPFAHRLQSVAQAVEQPTHRGRAHAPSLLGQRRRQFRAALARPPQRRCRVPARQRIYERFKGRQNTRLVLLDSRTSGARSPNAARRRFTSCDLAASIADRLPRQTGGRRHQRVAAIANRRRLGRCPPPATTLVQHRRYRAVLSDDVLGKWEMKLVAPWAMDPRRCSPRIASIRCLRGVGTYRRMVLEPARESALGNAVRWSDSAPSALVLGSATSRWCART